MPVTFMCSACGKTAPVGDDATTRRHWCKSCGAIMRIVYTKHCVTCHVDVTHSPRTRDVLGNYYCPACWEIEAKRQAAEHEAEARALAAGELFHCRVCRKNFPVDQVYAEGDGRTVCKGCWSALLPRTHVSVDAGPTPLDLEMAMEDSSIIGELEDIGDGGLPEGLELLPPEPEVAVAPTELEKEARCHNCGRVFARDELRTDANGALICQACRRYRTGWPID